jgi:hypothetical protein
MLLRKPGMYREAYGVNVIPALNLRVQDFPRPRHIWGHTFSFYFYCVPVNSNAFNAYTFNAYTFNAYTFNAYTFNNGVN